MMIVYQTPHCGRGHSPCMSLVWNEPVCYALKLNKSHFKGNFRGLVTQINQAGSGSQIFVVLTLYRIVDEQQVFFCKPRCWWSWWYRCIGETMDVSSTSNISGGPIMPVMKPPEQPQTNIFPVVVMDIIKGSKSCAILYNLISSHVDLHNFSKQL